MRIKHAPSGRWYEIFHQLTPLALTKSGKVWMVLCVDYIPSRIHSKDVLLRGSDKTWRYERKTGIWQEVDLPELNHNQKKVLYLAAQGCTMQQTAEMMCLSVDAVKKIRKQVFQILGVKSISEAINYVTVCRL